MSNKSNMPNISKMPGMSDISETFLDFNLPSSQFMVGVGLRPTHYPYLLQKPQTEVQWFEVITENFLDTLGKPMEVLEFIRKDYPVALHGVSLSIGQVDQWPETYLQKVKDLIQRINPFLVSDHLCWTGIHNGNLHNLLPLPYNDETLSVIVERIDRVQNFLQRPLILENLSAYFDFTQSTYTEWDFLKHMAKKSGCKLLLDVNNIYVNSVNHRFDPLLYLEGIDQNSVVEIHLAGFSDRGNFLFDTHDHPVYPEVWELFREACKKFSHVPVLVEWDDHIPEFPRLEEEAVKARTIWESVNVKEERTEISGGHEVSEVKVSKASKIGGISL